MVIGAANSCPCDEVMCRTYGASKLPAAHRRAEARRYVSARGYATLACGLLGVPKLLKRNF